jgi:hypothetical protein
MGRTVKTTATTRAVITNQVPATLTTVYTNNTGRGAELRSVNINGTGDVTNFVSTPGGTDWTIFGSNVNPLNQQASDTGTGFGIPYSVQLSDNRVLIFFLPHYQHRGGDGQDFMGGNMIHAQILEYQSNKYVAGPIVNIQLPDAAYNDTSFSLYTRPNNFSGSFGQTNFKAVALTPTKVVFGYRIRNNFRIVRVTISGNACLHTTENLNLTGPTFFNTTNNQAWDMDVVPGNTNKLVLGGWATSNWSLQAYNIPDSGTLSAATSLVSTGIPNSNYRFGLSRMVKTETANVTPYIIAASTSATAGSSIIFNFNSATDTFAAGSTAGSLPTASSEWSGIECGTMSTGTNVNAVIATMSTGNPGVMTFVRQTSSTVVNTSATTLTLQHSTSSRSISEEYQWGDERVVFMGEGQTLVVYDSAGTATNLMPNTETTNTTRTQQMWFPFNSRPLYNLYDPSSIVLERVSQWMARTSITSATSVGLSEMSGNYFPFGHDYGVGYAWNEPAGCWIAVQNGRIYALDSDGVIQSEISINNFDGAMDWRWHLNQVACGPSGRIYCQADFQIAVFPGGGYNCWDTWNNFSDQNRMFTIEAITSPKGLNSCFLVAAAQNTSTSHLGISMSVVVEANAAKTERAIFMGMLTPSNPIPYFVQWTGTTWANIGEIGYPRTGTTSWHRGFRPNFKLIQDTPTSTAFPLGLWRIVGSQGMDSSSRYRRGGITTANNPFTSPGSFNTASFPFDNTDTTQGWGVSYSQYNSGIRAGTTGPTPQIQVAAMYDETRGTMRVWSSLNGRLSFIRGWQVNPAATTFPIDNSRRWAKCTATKFGYSVSYQNTNMTPNTAVTYVFDTLETNTPKFTLTSSSGRGWVNSRQLNKTSWQIFGEGVDVVYNVGGIPDQVRFFIALDDGSGNTFMLNNGQLLDVVNSASGLFRSEDVYVIPAGWNLRVRADTPLAISSLLSIEENL